MKRVVTSYSLLPDTKIKIELLAHGLGKPISRLLDDLVDECWKKNAGKLRIDRLPKKYQSDLNRLMIRISTDTDQQINPEQLLKTGLSKLPSRRHRRF